MSRLLAGSWRIPSSTCKTFRPAPSRASGPQPSPPSGIPLSRNGWRPCSASRARSSRRCASRGIPRHLPIRTPTTSTRHGAEAWLRRGLRSRTSTRARDASTCAPGVSARLSHRTPATSTARCTMTVTSRPSWRRCGLGNSRSTRQPWEPATCCSGTRAPFTGACPPWSRPAPGSRSPRTTSPSRRATCNSSDAWCPSGSRASGA